MNKEWPERTNVFENYFENYANIFENNFEDYFNGIVLYESIIKNIKNRNQTIGMSTQKTEEQTDISSWLDLLN